VFATVAETAPRPTVNTVTATGFARVNHQAAPAITTTSKATTTIRFICILRAAQPLGRKPAKQASRHKAAQFSG
jgi:hypothetical protein